MDTGKRKVFLVFGTKRSGKHLLSKRFQDDSVSWNWKIFKRRGVNSLETCDVTVISYGDVLIDEISAKFKISPELDLRERIDESLFQILKAEIMNIPLFHGIPDDMPMLDHILAVPYRNVITELASPAGLSSEQLFGLTVRDVLSMQAKYNRNTDSTHFSKCVYNPISDQPEDDFMILGLRFSDELAESYAYLYERDIVTLRIFDFETFDSSSSKEEHDLDKTVVDYFLVPTEDWEDQIKIAADYFPYVSNFIVQEDTSILVSESSDEPEVSEEAVVPEEAVVSEEAVVPVLAEPPKLTGLLLPVDQKDRFVLADPPKLNSLLPPAANPILDGTGGELD